MTSPTFACGRVKIRACLGRVRMYACLCRHVLMCMYRPIYCRPTHLNYMCMAQYNKVD